MKKLILSAVMMMAFVGTSFAKTGEVENKKINSNSKQKKVVLLPNCDAAGRAAMIWYWNNTPDPSFNAGVALKKAVIAACNG